MDAACTSRRKACDFCVARKIKCDSLKPTCTNCTLYGTVCQITQASTTHASKKRALSRGHEEGSTSAQTSRVDALEARLANIEAHLETLATTQTRTCQNVASQDTNEVMPPLSNPAPASTPALSISEHLDLPPLAEVLPLVDRYFADYNRFTPLFDEPTFTRMLLDLYSHPNHRRPVAQCAAVNVVLAMTLRVLDGLSLQDPSVAACLRQVNYAMAELMGRREDTLGLQVLLGLAVVNQGCVDPQLSIVVIGSAVRIAQMMRLHSRQASVGCEPAVALHRRRLFWITYILDRDLSLRAHSPYLQLDAETDLDLPDRDPPDSLGMIFSPPSSPLNLLRARVQLAFIQGKAHDLLYSFRARALTPSQRQCQTSRVEHLLSDWHRRAVPDEFRRVDVVKQLGPAAAALVTNLLFRHAECLFRLRAVFSFDQAWIGRVTRYLEPTVIELRGDDEADGEVVRSELTPLPDEWTECVEYCRRCLALACLGQTDYSLWLHACGTFSILVVLTVNMIEFPDHEAVSRDRALIDAWHEMFVRAGLKCALEHSDMFKVLEQLDRRARGQVKRIAQSGGGGGLGFVGDDLLVEFDWTSGVEYPGLDG